MSTVKPLTTSIVTRVPTTIPITTKTKGIPTTTQAGISTTTRGSVPYNGNRSGKTIHLSKGAAIALAVVLVVVVAGLILVFAWYRRNKQRQSRDLSRTKTLSEPGFTSGVLPYRSPLVGILIRDPEPHLPQGHQPVYVESAAPRVPGVETGNYSIPNPNPGPLSSPSASSRTAPPPRGLSRVPTVQKETHFLGSHRDETGGNVVG